MIVMDRVCRDKAVARAIEKEEVLRCIVYFSVLSV